MKNLKFLASVLIMTLACVTFTSCSDDDKDEPSAANLEGVWICTESTYSGEWDDVGPFSIGDGLKLMSQSFTSNDKLVSGKICFLRHNGKWLDVEHGVTGEPTADDWWAYTIGWGGDEFGYVYSLNGNKLSIIECDLDRTVGTISIDGNTLTYTYTCQYWIADPYNVMTDESETYISKFKKQ